MKKILYFSPVDWNWIKQRPQFLAEQLSDYYDITVVYPYKNMRQGLQKTKTSKLRIEPYYSIPYILQNYFCLKGMNNWLINQQIARITKYDTFDLIWCSMPWQIDLLKSFTGKIPIIYDCMDDYLSISSDINASHLLATQEMKMVKNAKIILASSDNLRKKLISRYNLLYDDVYLVRNGYDSDWQQKYENKTNKKFYSIGYFGTIGRWFDFEKLLYSLTYYDDIEYHLYGPIEKGICIPKNKKIIWHGTVEHREIPKIANDMDALIMPFTSNEIVYSVDPVKLYEYIFLGKNIISVYYEEIDRFSSFVHFYTTTKSFMNQIKVVRKLSKPIYSETEALKFLSNSTWKKRAEQIYKILKNQWR